MTNRTFLKPPMNEWCGVGYTGYNILVQWIKLNHSPFDWMKEWNVQSHITISSSGAVFLKFLLEAFPVFIFSPLNYQGDVIKFKLDHVYQIKRLSCSIFLHYLPPLEYLIVEAVQGKNYPQQSDYYFTGLEY